MCDHQRQTFRDGVTMPCAVPECEAGGIYDGVTDMDGEVQYTRECFLPAPEGTPAFWFWLRREA